MKPEDKVCTLEQAKRLVELGVVLETEKVWVEFAGGVTMLLPYYAPPKVDVYVFPAPDVAELGELLPRVINDDFILDLWKAAPGYNGGFGFSIDSKFYSEDPELDQEFYPFRTEAQARCAALIWLIENGYIKKEEICQKDK